MCLEAKNILTFRKTSPLTIKKGCWKLLIKLGIYRKPNPRQNSRRSKLRRKVNYTKANIKKESENKTFSQLPCILTTHLQSICKKIDMLNQLLEDSNPDIACLSQTWITNDKSHIITNQLHPNFHISVKNREDRTGMV